MSCLGHGHPDVLAALHKQLDTLAYAHTGFFTTDVAEQLADRLIEDAPAGLDHVYLVSGGSEGDRGGAEDGAAVFRREGRDRSAGTSSRGGRAITATRWARWRPAAMNGAAPSSVRC